MTYRTQKQLNLISRLPASRQGLEWLRQAKEPLASTFKAARQRAQAGQAVFVMGKQVDLGMGLVRSSP